MSISLPMEPELQAAAARLASRLTALFAVEMDRLHRAARTLPNSTPPRRAKASPAPAIESAAREPSASPKRVPLSQRKNVFRVPTGSPLPPRPTEEASGTGQELLAQTALKVIEQAGARLTPDELRARLNASFAPIIDGLVAGEQSLDINRGKS